MKQIIKYILCISLLIFQTIMCTGQPTCHSPINQERARLINELLKQRTDKNYNGNMPMVRLALHNIRKTDGTGGFSWTDIRNVVAGLPDFFEPHNICFTVISENNVDADSYFLEEDDGIYWRELLNENRVQGAINVYFLYSWKGGRSTGFLFDFPTDFPTVTLGNTAEGGDGLIYSSFNTAILAHELGHCLGLYHTDLSGEQIPRTGPLANCTTASDELCDTPADPGLEISTANIDNETSCVYIGKDSLNGYAYRPDTRNVMSYTLPGCMQRFSNGQGDKMRGYIQIDIVMDDYVIRDDITLTGTTSYNRYYGTENSITSSAKHFTGEVIYEAGNEIKLQNGFKISSTNASFHAKLGTYSCVEPLVTNHGKMTKGNDSDIPIKEEVFDFKMYPNPAADVFTMDLNLTEAETINITITDITGKTYLTRNQDLGQGNHKFELNVSMFRRGIYFVNVMTAKNYKTRKLVIE